MTGQPLSEEEVLLCTADFVISRDPSCVMRGIGSERTIQVVLVCFVHWISTGDAVFSFEGDEPTETMLLTY